MDIRSNQVVILDFGSQYTKLIARRIRELKVFSEILPSNSSLEEIKKYNPNALILSGGPASVFAKSALKYDSTIFNLEIPILGICYGLQMMVHHYGGTIIKSKVHEYGSGTINITKNKGLFNNFPSSSNVWMSHSDEVTKIPNEWTITATSSNGIIAGIENQKLNRFATQFHPEVNHTEKGEEILSNFVFNIAECKPNWTSENFINEKIDEIRNQIKSTGNVVTAVSGGVDSSVMAVLMNKAIGSQAESVLIDHGLMRKDEAKECITALKDELGININFVDESEIFLKKLKGVKNPEKKRKIIGEQFIRSFEKFAQDQHYDYLAQGTLYTDVIESGGIGVSDTAKVIKSHHNVGGLPKDIKFELIEPLRDLFKDEVRKIGKSLGLPENILNRHPFPGPGLSVRILGEVTKKRIKILQEADNIYINILKDENLYDEIWQAFSVLIPVKTVGVMGDNRTYEYIIGLRAVTSLDGMTADWYRIPDKVLSKISNKIVNSVKGINRVVFDITSKPPGTIEWE